MAPPRAARLLPRALAGRSMPSIVVRHGGPTNTRSTDHPVARVLVDVDGRGLAVWSELWPSPWQLLPDGLFVIVIDDELPRGYSQNAPLN
jgi:hypothetical protein